MSMYPQALAAIPEETVRVARAACPKGNLAMRLRDELAELYQLEKTHVQTRRDSSRNQSGPY